ncbi:MAG TPA: primosomal protein N' [Hyphomicrobiales bacterium]|nr:primosomal protein N' [Hyphomicrobiales bacterium]
MSEAELFDGDAGPAGATARVRRVEVLLPVALDRSFTYALPRGLDAQPGALVRVPLGGRDAFGVVWDGAGDALPAARLKPVAAVLDHPPLPAELRTFVDWVARYTLTPLGLVLRMALRGTGEVGFTPPPRIGVAATGMLPPRMTAARQRVLDAAGPPARGWAKGDLARAAGVSPGVIEGLLAARAFTEIALPVPPPPGSGLDPDHAPPRLNREQAEVARALAAAVSEGGFSTHLVEGVTGAGKTEVYLEAVAAALRARRQVLVLLPEIALTKAVFDRLAARFGAAPAEWHSALSARQRARTWEAVASGEAKVVVGARSALFLPFSALGAIVVDEEHDAGFKQEDMPVYHARDMAVVRARSAGVPAILVSATPSLESRINAEAGRYRRHLLPRRHGGQSLPAIEIVDLLKAPPPRGRFIAPALEEATRAALGRGEQALLFLNRRGYAPLTLCRACGHRLQCPNCTAWLVEHRLRRVLACHHCGHGEPVPEACPQCGAVGTLTPVGPGVERIVDEARAVFPDARLAVLSSDLTTGAERLREELHGIAEHRVDLVVGTQLVTKGHHFPDLTLVGVVDADLGLSTADPRAAERTFQLLDQVTGRAGRGARPGRGLVQTYDAQHPVMQALKAGRRDEFYAAEAEARADAALPPFGRLASIVVSAPERTEAESHARALARAFPEAEGIRLLGPAEAPLALLRGRHRQRLIVKAPRNCDLSGLIRAWLGAAPAPRGGTLVAIDVDPMSFL